MLIHCDRITSTDMMAWHQAERMDARNALPNRRIWKRAARARADIERWVSGREYCGVSWGKDSVVVAHMVRQVAPTVPLVWVRVEPIKNPECAMVRDAFLARFPGPYDEIEAWCEWRDDHWHAGGTLEAGFATAAERHGDRYISGIRAEESAGRALRNLRYGVSTSRTCAPLTKWSGADVFAYLYAHNLPVHPAYAMTFGGLLERDRIRVASLGGRRGSGMGRVEWEQRYYQPELVEMGRWRDAGD